MGFYERQPEKRFQPNPGKDEMIIRAVQDSMKVPGQPSVQEQPPAEQDELADAFASLEALEDTAGRAAEAQHEAAPESTPPVSDTFMSQAMRSADAWADAVVEGKEHSPRTPANVEPVNIDKLVDEAIEDAHAGGVDSRAA